jgi:hypothetical protein
VDWEDRPPIPHTTPRTPSDIEDRIWDLRRQLAEHSNRGHSGAAAIFEALLERGTAPLPSIRRIGRILRRRGALAGQRRVRRPSPPPGWSRPALAARPAEWDSLDLVEGLAIKDGPDLEVLNAVALDGGLVGWWPHQGAVPAAWVVAALIEHWGGVGLPSSAQFDHETICTGPHTHPNTIGRVRRLGLGLGIVPGFVPPRQTGFPAMIEGCNGLWPAKVWARFTFPTPGQV